MSSAPVFTFSETPFHTFFDEYSVIVREATETTREAILYLTYFPAEGRMNLQVYDVAENTFPHKFTSTKPDDVRGFFFEVASVYASDGMSWLRENLWLRENVEIFLTLLPQAFHLNDALWNDDGSDFTAEIEAFYFPAINDVYSSSIGVYYSYDELGYTSVGGVYSADAAAEVVKAVTAYRDAALLREGQSSERVADADAFLAKVAAL